jgi:hypothetical protein
MRSCATELEVPRLAAKTEKRATKSAKIQILLFSESVAANQNQKFPFHFLSAPPTPPAENIKKGRKIFGFVPRPEGADEARLVLSFKMSSRKS